MEEDRIQRTAYLLAVRRGLVDSESITASFTSGASLKPFVDSGVLDPVSADRLWAEASLILPEEKEGEEGGNLLGLYPLRHTDRYQPELYLGDGGMGRVFRAYDTLLKRRVALKFFRTSLPQEVKVFEREAQSQARIDHPHVARIFEAGELEGFPFLSMQFIHGPTLAKASPDLSRDDRIEMVRQACLGIHAAHRLGIVHRDLKPGNIMLEKDDQGDWKAFVMDFGLARDLSDPAMLPSTTVMGTPAFMAPEQVLGPAVLVGPHTDVYALGVTLFQLITGELPFPGNNHAVIFRKLVEEDAPPLRFFDSEIPVDLEAIVQKCMEKDILRRYDSALDLAEDLQRFLEGVPVVARPLPRWRRWRRKYRRNTLAFSAIGLALILGLGWMAFAWRSRGEVAAMQGRITAQSQDLTRALSELEGLRQAQNAERLKAEALQFQVAQARTPLQREAAEKLLQESRQREQALAAQVALAQQRPVPLNPAPKPESPATDIPATRPVPDRTSPTSNPEPESPIFFPPQMVWHAPVNYPSRALAAPNNKFRTMDVSVLLQVQLDAQGQVQDVQVGSGVEGPWGYNEAAIAAIRSSTFAPAQRGGHPVPGTLQVNVTFPKARR